MTPIQMNNKVNKTWSNMSRAAMSDVPIMKQVYGTSINLHYITVWAINTGSDVNSLAYTHIVNINHSTFHVINLKTISN